MTLSNNNIWTIVNRLTIRSPFCIRKVIL